MATNVLPDNDDDLKTVRIPTTDLDLGTGTESFGDVRPISDPGDDAPTVVVRGPDRVQNDDEKTVLIRRTPRTSAPEAPAAAPPAEEKEDSPECWCVGWLVAITGPMKGRAFQLRLGMNHVGRSANNNICLEEDEGISRDAQIIVTYDRRRNQFFVAPGMSCSQTSELNDNILLSPSPLATGDIVQLSDDTKVRFTAFCDSQFHWEY